MVSFWEDPRNIPFKGELVSFAGDAVCMCAQGQTLHKFGGYSVDTLRYMSLKDSDIETAKILDISIAHSALLRNINDTFPGSPQDVLTNPEKYLGPNFQAVLDFWRKLDDITFEEIILAETRQISLNNEKARKNAYDFYENNEAFYYFDAIMDAIHYRGGSGPLLQAAFLATLEIAFPDMFKPLGLVQIFDF